MENRYWVLGRICGKLPMWPPMLRPGYLGADRWTGNSKCITSFYLLRSLGSWFTAFQLVSGLASVSIPSGVPWWCSSRPSRPIHLYHLNTSLAWSKTQRPCRIFSAHGRLPALDKIVPPNKWRGGGLDRALQSKQNRANKRDQIWVWAFWFAAILRVRLVMRCKTGGSRSDKHIISSKVRSSAILVIDK